jgi:phosphoenolpyruvate-protein kinase (PTS system EI component)
VRRPDLLKRLDAELRPTTSVFESVYPEAAPGGRGKASAAIHDQTPPATSAEYWLQIVQEDADEKIKRLQRARADARATLARVEEALAAGLAPGRKATLQRHHQLVGRVAYLRSRLAEERSAALAGRRVRGLRDTRLRRAATAVQQARKAAHSIAEAYEARLHQAKGGGKGVHPPETVRGEKGARGALVVAQNIIPSLFLPSYLHDHPAACGG